MSKLNSTKKEALEKLTSLSASEVEIGNIACNYFSARNAGVEVDKEKLFNGISSKKVRKKVEELCDLVDFLIQAREAKRRPLSE